MKKLPLLIMLSVGLIACSKKNGSKTDDVRKSAAASQTAQAASANQAETKPAPTAKPAAAPTPSQPEPAKETPKMSAKLVVLSTNKGDIKIELFSEKAPQSVANFVNYVQSGHYNGTIFHRVIDNFMIQGGGYTTSFEKKPTNPPVENEADNGLANARGTVSLARTSDPHSATAQFFINVKDNGFLNHSEKSARGWGYAVFGKVVEGMDVIDTIKSVKTGPRGPFPKDVPVEHVVIESAKAIE